MKAFVCVATSSKEGTSTSAEGVALTGGGGHGTEDGGGIKDQAGRPGQEEEMYVEGIEKLVRLSDHEQTLIETALRAYAEQCEKDAALFDVATAQIPAEPEPNEVVTYDENGNPTRMVKVDFITSNGARMMADQFRRYREQTFALLTKIQGDDEEGEPGYALALIQEEGF